MKNKLFYLIGVAHLLSYISRYTSCVSNVGGKYSQLPLTNNKTNYMSKSL